jgi:mannose-6-phosphate isomerase-like protein (cupin superfamily)
MASVTVINLGQRIRQIDKPWSPLEVARVNDQVVRLAMVEGEYHWHKHANEDELFYVIEGNVTIELKGQPDVHLGEGEMAAVPKGVEHRPRSEEVSYLLVFEPHALVSRGD